MKAQKVTKETITSIGAPERNFPDFQVGDTVEVSLLVTEGKRERAQLFEGDVIALHKNGASSTFTVRRLSANNIWVEKIFPYYSPVIKEIKLIKQGVVRRAKLYYLRDRVGRQARVKEMILTKEQKQEASKKKSLSTQADG